MEVRASVLLAFSLRWPRLLTDHTIPTGHHSSPAPAADAEAEAEADVGFGFGVASSNSNSNPRARARVLRAQHAYQKV